MKQKIIKVGNSAGILIPKHMLEDLGAKVGDEVSVDLQGKTVTFEAANSLNDQGRLTPEFKQWLDKISKTHEATIKELARV